MLTEEAKESMWYEYVKSKLVRSNGDVSNYY